MVEKFIEEYAKLIASEPENVSVSRVNLGESFDEIHDDPSFT